MKILFWNCLGSDIFGDDAIKNPQKIQFLEQKKTKTATVYVKDYKYYCANLKDVIKNNSFHISLLLIITKILKNKIPKIFQRFIFKFVINEMDGNDFEIICMGYPTLEFFGMIYNQYFRKWFFETKSKKILFLQDTLDSIETVYGSLFKNELTKLIDLNYFSKVASFLYTDTNSKIQYVRFCYDTEKFQRQIKLIECSKKFEKQPNKFDIVSINSVCVNFETYNSEKRMLLFYNAISVFEKNDINFEYVLSTFGFPKTQKELEVYNYITEHQNLENLRSDNFPYGNLLHLIINSCIVMHVSGKNYLSHNHWFALIANKPIVTDAKCIKLEKWYDPRFVHIMDFENITQDDINWIKNTMKSVRNGTLKCKYSNTEVLQKDYFLSEILKNV